MLNTQYVNSVIVTVQCAELLLAVHVAPPGVHGASVDVTLVAGEPQVVHAVNLTSLPALRTAALTLNIQRHYSITCQRADMSRINVNYTLRSVPIQHSHVMG